MVIAGVERGNASFGSMTGDHREIRVAAAESRTALSCKKDYNQRSTSAV